MATEFQVTFDRADPGAHAAFWVEAVHYIQPPPPPGFDSWDGALEGQRVPPRLSRLRGQVARTSNH
jgi:hypothetical protein